MDNTGNTFLYYEIFRIHYLLFIEKEKRREVGKLFEENIDPIV